MGVSSWKDLVLIVLQILYAVYETAGSLLLVGLFSVGELLTSSVAAVLGLIRASLSVLT